MTKIVVDAAEVDIVVVAKVVLWVNWDVVYWIDPGVSIKWIEVVFLCML